MQPILRFGAPSEHDLLHIQPQLMPGNLVQLEPLNSTHIDELTLAAGDPSTWDWLFDARIYLEYGMQGLVVYLLECQKRGTDIPFAIIHRPSKLAVGITRYLHIRKQDRQLEIATWLAGDYREKGLNTEAKWLLLRYVFDVLKFIRVEFDIDGNNEPSIKAIKNIGATCVGTIPKRHILPDGVERTSVLYSITDDDWKSRVKAHLIAKVDKYQEDEDRHVLQDVVRRMLKGLTKQDEQNAITRQKLESILRPSTE